MPKPKTKVTKDQIKDMIQQRLGFAAMLTIHPEKKQGLGFTAGVMTRPDSAVNTQNVVDQIVSELRAEYELVDG